MEVAGAEPRRHAIVEHHPVFAQHQAIAAAADLELGPGVGVDAIEEFGAVVPLQVDLAERARIEQAHPLTYGQALALDGGAHVLAGAREVTGTLPVADILEHRAPRRRPVMAGRAADGIEQFAAMRAGQRAEGDRRVGHAEGRRPHRLDRQAALVGHDRQSVDVAGLALVGPHAGRGVALDVLDRLEALADCETEILGGDVVLEIDERLGPGRCHPAGYGPSWQQRRELRLVDRRRFRRVGGETGRCGGLCTGPSAFGEAGRERMAPLAEPAERSAWIDRPGTKAAASSSNLSLPRDCENKWTVGFQPPETSRQSQRSA